MDYADSLPKQRRFGQTNRPDTWWLQPLAVFIGFAAFIIYSTWVAFQGIGDVANHTHTYWFNGGGANYLSPFYSPELWGTTGHELFGPVPGWWPGWLPFSPAFLILWAPAGFRFTCYYYRGAYYKAFWADPLNCAVGEPRKTYWGERYFPLILQNVHRYLFYIAAIFIVILSYDAWCAMWFKDPLTGKEHFGIGLGTVVMILNAVFLALYTFGCHSLRHLIGGFRNTKSKSACAKSYNCVSCLNRKHMFWAWVSLFWVGFTDVYIRYLAPHIDVVFFKL